MECCVYSKASENTGIEKSARYNLKDKEIIVIIVKIKKIFFRENNDNRVSVLFIQIYISES